MKDWQSFYCTCIGMSQVFCSLRLSDPDMGMSVLSEACG